MSGLRTAAFLVGGVLYGAFLAAVVERVPARRPVLGVGATCTGCGSALRSGPRRLAHVIGMGRCPSCRARGPWTNPVVEVLVAGLCAGAAATFDSLSRAGLAAAFVGVVAALGFIDAQHRILPNAIVYPAFIIFAVAIVAGSVSHSDVSLTHAVIGAAAFGAPLLVIALVSPKGMGMGDVKLAALIGLVLGAFGLRYVGVAASVGILAGGLGSAVALAAGRSRKSTIPFGPYLVLGAIVSTFFAPAIARAYG